MIKFTILGEPASKANSLELSTFTKFSPKKNRHVAVPRMRKSDKARDYERTAQLQIPPEARQMLQGPLRVTMRIYYASERSDLDESVILDVLQTERKTVADGYEKIGDGQYVRVQTRKLIRQGVYINDRQVREKHIYHGIDKANPRAEIEVEQLVPELFPVSLGRIDRELANIEREYDPAELAP